MTIEKPLVGWKQICSYLNVENKKARRIIKRAKVSFLPDYLPTVAIYPSTLKKYLEKTIYVP